jgi:RNA polymerase sigma-70 factor (ECF subfamily)
MEATFQLSNEILQYERLLRSFAYNFTQSQEETEDLIQDTFYKAWINQDKFMEGTNLKAWLFTIMRNIFINNYHKKRRNIKVNHSSDDPYLISSTVPIARNGSERTFLGEYIRIAMSEISDDFTSPFMMYFNGFSYNEIAQKLNLPLGTVKSRIFFARKEMQSNLRKLGITNSAFYN